MRGRDETIFEAIGLQAFILSMLMFRDSDGCTIEVRTEAKCFHPMDSSGLIGSIGKHLRVCQLRASEKFHNPSRQKPGLALFALFLKGQGWLDWSHDFLQDMQLSRLGHSHHPPSAI